MSKDYILFLTSKTIGDGAEQLGEKLMSNYLNALSEGEDLPTHIIMLNNAVYLAIKEAKTVKSLTTLLAKGVKVLACGTCLDYYEVKEQLAVGEVGNIFVVRDLLASSNKVVTVG